MIYDPTFTPHCLVGLARMLWWLALHLWHMSEPVISLTAVWQPVWAFLPIQHTSSNILNQWKTTILYPHRLKFARHNIITLFFFVVFLFCSFLARYRRSLRGDHHWSAQSLQALQGRHTQGPCHQCQRLCHQGECANGCVTSCFCALLFLHFSFIERASLAQSWLIYRVLLSVFQSFFFFFRRASLTTCTAAVSHCWTVSSVPLTSWSLARSVGHFLVLYAITFFRITLCSAAIHWTVLVICQCIDLCCVWPAQFPLSLSLLIFPIRWEPHIVLIFFLKIMFPWLAKE